MSSTGEHMGNLPANLNPQSTDTLILLVLELTAQSTKNVSLLIYFKGHIEGKKSLKILVNFFTD